MLKQEENQIFVVYVDEDYNIRVDYTSSFNNIKNETVNKHFKDFIDVVMNFYKDTLDNLRFLKLKNNILSSFYLDISSGEVIILQNFNEEIVNFRNELSIINFNKNIKDYLKKLVLIEINEK